VKSPSPVNTATVTINGADTVLTNTFGTDTRGAWSNLVAAADCAVYYFTVSFDDSKTERFPPTGYLFNSESPETCEVPDGDPDSDAAQPDDDTSGGPDDDQTDSAEQPEPDLRDEDITIPYDFNPKDEDHAPPDYGPTDWDYIPPDIDRSHGDEGCGCGIIF